MQLQRAESNRIVEIVHCGVPLQVMILSYLGPSARCEWGLTAAQESTLTSMVFLGMTLGAPGERHTGQAELFSRIHSKAFTHTSQRW